MTSHARIAMPGGFADAICRPLSRSRRGGQQTPDGSCVAACRSDSFGMSQQARPIAMRPPDLEIPVMTSCAACKQLIVFGSIRRDDKCFCSHACMNTIYSIGFCPICIGETDERSPVNLTQAAGCGAGLYNSWWHANCPECGSQVARVWIALFGLPIIPLRCYRVFYLGDFEFWARRLLRHRTSRVKEDETSQ
jgi:hypothetical protein